MPDLTEKAVVFVNNSLGDLEMKICPECGFIDRSHWRQNRWRTNVEFLKYMENPEDLEASILEELKQGHPYAKDKLFAYRLSSGVVERVLRVDYEAGGKSAFHIPRERHKPMDPYQQKIGEKKEGESQP